MIAIVSVVMLAASVAAAASVTNPPVIVFAMDGVASRYVQTSETMMRHMVESQYTLRGRGTEHARGYEGWMSVLQGGYDFGTKRPTLFSHIRSQKPNATLWTFTGHEVVRDACGTADADIYRYVVGVENVVDAFFQELAKLRASPFGAQDPTLTVLYAWDADAAGHNFGWGSHHYLSALQAISNNLARIKEAMPHAVIYFISDHGGQGAGHSYASRDHNNDNTNIDSTLYRDVPWARFSGNEHGAICNPIRNEDTMSIVASDLGIQPHTSWRRMSGPFNATCTDASVMSLHNHHSSAGILGVVWCVIFSLLALGVS